MFAYFTFRFRQLFRYLSAAGGNLFVLIPFVIFLLYSLSKVLSNIGIEGTQLMLALTVLSLGLRRKDTVFLRSVFKYNSWRILLIEYLIVYLILELFALSVHAVDLLMIPPLLLIFSLVVYQSLWKIKITKFNLTRRLSSILPLHAFEWRSGIRQSPHLFLSSYIIGLILIFFFPITPLMMLYWISFSGEFYAYIEAREIIQSYRTGKHFYKQKIKSLLLVCNLLFIPHYLLFSILYNSTQILILLTCIIFFNMLFSYVLLLKYTLKPINSKVQNTFPITLYFVSMAVLPLSLYLIHKIWRKNREKLSALLN